MMATWCCKPCSRLAGWDVRRTAGCAIRVGAFSADGIGDRPGSRVDGSAHWPVNGPRGLGYLRAARDADHGPRVPAEDKLDVLPVDARTGHSPLPGTPARGPGRATRAQFFNAKNEAGTSVSIALVGVQPGGFIARRAVGRSELGRTPTGVVISRGLARSGLRVGGASPSTGCTSFCMWSGSPRRRPTATLTWCMRR